MPVVSDYWTALDRVQLVNNASPFRGRILSGGLSVRAVDQPYLEVGIWSNIGGRRRGTATFRVNGRVVGRHFIRPNNDFDFGSQLFHFDVSRLRSGGNTLEVTVSDGVVLLESIVCHFKQRI